VIGGLTKDYLEIYGKYREETVGGGAFYSSIGAKKLNHSVVLFTIVGEDFEKKYLELINSFGIEVILQKTNKTIKFLNRLIKPGYREQEVISFSKEKISKIPFDISDFDIIHITPVLNEVEDNLVDELMSNDFNKKVSLEVQGFVREEKEGPLKKIFWKQREKWINRSFSLHLSKEELLFAVKRSVLELFRNSQLKFVSLTLSSYGSFDFSRNERVYIPQPEDLIFENDVGCGDIYSIVFSLEVAENKSLIEAGVRATALSILRAKHNKIENFFYDNSFSEIENRVREYYKDYGLYQRMK